jgi:hypothetical protein
MEAIHEPKDTPESDRRGRGHANLAARPGRHDISPTQSVRGRTLTMLSAEI